MLRLYKMMEKQQSSSTQLSKRASVTKLEAAALVQTKVTNMAATHPHLLAATVQSLGHEVRGSHMSRSSIRQAGRFYQEECACMTKNEFSPDCAMVVH